LDTKWKSRAFAAAWLILFTFGLSGMLHLYIKGNHYFAKDYFESMEFHDNLIQFVQYVGLFELDEMSLEEAKKGIKVTEEDIQEHRYRYGNLVEQINIIKSQYEGQIAEAEGAGNQEAADFYKAERDKKIEDITNNFKSDDHVLPKVVAEKEKQVEEFYLQKERLHQDYQPYKDSLVYYFKDTVTGEEYSNLEKSSGQSYREAFNKQDFLYKTSNVYSNDFFYSYGLGFEESVDSIIPEKTFESWIGIPKSLSSSHPIMAGYKQFNKEQIISYVVSIAAFAILVLCLIVMKKRRVIPSDLEDLRPNYEKLPLDARLFLLFILWMAGIPFLFITADKLAYVYNPVDAIELLIALAGAAFFVGIFLLQARFLLPSLKSWTRIKQDWESALIYRGWKEVRDLYSGQSFGRQAGIGFVLLFGLGLLTVMVIGVYPHFLPIYVMLYLFAMAAIFILFVKKVRYFSMITERTNRLAAGQLGPDLPVKGKSVLGKLAGNLNQLKQGVKKSQSEQAKSERLKTELITNVSHDLRTPLTSIITYTELLKAADLPEEDRSAYLEIIDRKSKRLKVLIDDLFEVSKMASGNIELKREKVDLVQLLQQALAEYDSSIGSLGLQVRISQPDAPVHALVDGQKLWRVFDNLIGNILKYSLENTRVYILVQAVGDFAEITFKNVSKYELSENVDELFERFKRGDTSRHTEGSGLGLAIAQSIVYLHGGSLDIEADGDLFKAKVKIKMGTE
jgi:signal transduction histidine kinase